MCLKVMERSRCGGGREWNGRGIVIFLKLVIDGDITRESLYCN